MSVGLHIYVLFYVHWVYMLYVNATTIYRYNLQQLSFIFQFQFVNSFLSLFYIAFYLQDQERLKEVRIQFNYQEKETIK